MLYQNALNEFQLLKAQRIYEAGVHTVTYWNEKDADCVFALSSEEAKRVWDRLIHYTVSYHVSGISAASCVPCQIQIQRLSDGCVVCFYARNGHGVCEGSVNSTWRQIGAMARAGLVSRFERILSYDFYLKLITHLQRKYRI